MIRAGFKIFLNLSLCIVACALLVMGGAKAEGTVTLSAGQQLIDLAEQGTRVAAQRRNLALEVPGEKDESRAVLELHGVGAGPTFNWTIYTVRNGAGEARELVVSVEAQRLAASGIVHLRPFGSQLENIQWLQTAVSPVPQNASSAQAYRFELKPNEAMTFGIEGPAVLKGVRVFDVKAFTQYEASFAFLRGAALAVGFVLALSILSLYGIRANSAFLVGGAFGFASLVFMALEAGYLQQLTHTFENLNITYQHLRALSESLMALAIALCFWGLTSLKRRSLMSNLPFFMLIFSMIGLLAYSFYFPLRATQTARWAIVALTVAGFVMALRSRRIKAEVMDNAVLFWSGLLVWVFFAAAAALGESHSPTLHALLLAGLTSVLGVLAFVLLRLAFAQGFLSKPYLTDSSRRSLALTGAQHFLWDWQPQENLLDIGTELARSLGHSINSTTQTAALRWFAALVHPADDLAYRKCLDLRSLKAGSFVEQELRLRDGQGNYHWFTLRARALPGAGGVPARLIGTLTDISKSKQTEDRLINESIHDPVTGLPSRALFLDRVEREIAKPLALPRRILMVGLERFKILNDGLGHDLGDQLLLAVGQRIAETLSPEESVARISGSQFAVMQIEDIAGHDAEALASEIMYKLAEPISVLSQQIYLSACIGISLSSANGLSAATLQQQAESALHVAQSEGPRTISIFDEDVQDERAEKVELEADLRRAIDRHEIEVHYQPIINLMTRDVAGFEALARWQHPTRGLLQPAEFIGLAEQAGMISEIGDLVLAESMRQMGIWLRIVARNRSMFITVNVSAEQLSDTGFIDRLTSALTREGVMPHAVKVEITESVVMRYPERARQMVTRLRNFDIGVACDDFGTGFSNLASLRDLNFDTLKIDRSFISSEGLTGRGSVILQSVIDMAHRLGMTVVAEGIETEEQAQHLLIMGCELGQGYYLGQPLASRDVHGLLAVLPLVGTRPTTEVYTEVEPEPESDYDPTTESYAAYDESQEPEELPSLFAVNAPPKPKKKAVKKPATKTVPKSKSKKPIPKKAAAKKRKR